VRGGGRVIVAFSGKRAARAIASSARSTSVRGIRVGDSLRELRRKGGRRLAGDLFVSHGVVFGVSGKRVRFVAVAERALVRHPRLLQSYLSAIEL
jgi:hypothetical protein